MPGQTTLNILANFFGRSWASLMTLVFVPLYIKFMGVEAYGLVGFFVTLKALSGFLDLGFSTTLNRELARFSVDDSDAHEVVDTARTIEVLYWGLAGVVLVLISVLAPVIARHWINSDALAHETVGAAIRLMGIVITLGFPFALYSGALMGLQRQVLVNAINVIIGTLRGAGAVLVLWLVSPTIEAFFIWQALVAVIETAVTMICLWQVLPGRFLNAGFRSRILRRVRRFAAGMTGIGLSNVLLTQVDKIVLIKLLPLKIFGYYTIAVTIASGIQSLLVYPVSNAVFPRLAQLVKSDPEAALVGFYHRACQLIVLLIIPIGGSIAFFSSDILFLWTRDVSVAANAHLILSVIMVGYILNSAIIIPYMLQLASGWTGLTLAYNLICVVVLIPALILGVKTFGVIGGAAILMVQNASYILFVIPLMHRTLLPTEKGRWYRSDVGRPLAAGLVSGVGLWLMTSALPVAPLFKIGVMIAGMGAAVVWVSSETKSLIRTVVVQLQSSRFGRRGIKR